MNKLNILPILFLLLFSTNLSSCKDDFERPPLPEPHVPEGVVPNITIAQLKDLYKNVQNPTLIDVDYVLKGTVIGNDISGNIYKQLYIQDNTGGINFGVDQNSIYTRYRIGQQVVVRLKGLYMVSYGEQLQIGYDKTNANRIPYERFTQSVFEEGWPLAENAEPRTVTLGDLSDELVNTLIRLDNVYFVEGGKAKFSDPTRTTNRILKDGQGRQIIVRNSNYASFANEMLPKGGGTIVAVLSKFRSDYQLLLRSLEDVTAFGQPLPGGGSEPTPDPGKPDPSDPPVASALYEESFGPADVSDRPFVENYTGFSNKQVKYSADPQRTISVRTTKLFTSPHLWIPAKKEASFIIEGIDTSAGKDPALVYELAANLYNAGEEQNINALEVTVDGKSLAVPSKVLSKDAGDGNKVYVVSLTGIPAKKDLKVTFRSNPSANTLGIRLFNVKIVSTSGKVDPVRPK